jgi:hypothetical protein
MAKVFFRKAELDFFLNSPKGDVGRYLAEKGDLVMAAARVQVGVRTGALRRSIHMRHLRDSRGQYVKIGSNLDYALVHHEGSKPHVIRPARTKVLRFVKGSMVIYSPEVMHPRVQANRYLSDNLKSVK